MTTSLNSGISERDVAYHLVHYLRKAIDVGAVTTGTVVTVGKLPAGAIVMGGSSGVYMSTSLTGGGSTNNVDIGFATDTLASANSTAYASALNLTTTTGGFTVLDEIAASINGRKRANVTTVTATWTGSASTGVFDVVIAYMPDR